MLYLNGHKLKLMYNGKELSLMIPSHSSDTPVVPDVPDTPEVPDTPDVPVVFGEYWDAPVQEASVYKPWSYSELIAKYDELMAQAPDYITKYRYEKDGNPVLTRNGGLELYHYVLEPENYSKTIFIHAGIHGNEMDAKQQLLRVVNILVNKTNMPGYEIWQNIRNDVRLVIIPCVSPYGHETSKMNVPYGDTQYGINLNRNYDFNHQNAIPGTGVGGNAVMDMVECQHTLDVINKIGVENIDYAMDWHDGGSVEKHFWINYAIDGYNRDLVNNLVSHLCTKYNIENPIIPDCKDSKTTGSASMYFAKSLGLNGSVVEWIGGLLGYDFGATQMTRSLEIRGNMLLQAYALNKKGWQIYEEPNQSFFHFDYPKAFTVDGLRKDEASAITKVPDSKIYNRWDKLQAKYPSLISKSEKLGTDVTGNQDIYTYTFGNGSNKVLYVGGIMRYGASHKIDEYAIYELVEYLCNDYIVNQSRFLQELKNNYTIIVLPCIDNTAGSAQTIRNCGLNNMALSYKKWQIVDGKCQPTDFALSCHDVPIVKNIIDNNQDLKCIVSGGEICSGYNYNAQDYSTDFETHFVTPKNQVASDDLSAYINHLSTDRNENVVAENTAGTTFGDYAYDNYGIPTYYVQLKVSKRYTELASYHSLTEDEYLHHNYEAGRRIANIANLFLIG